LCTSCKSNSHRSACIQDLPEKILVHIFSFVDVFDLGAIFATCKQWHAIGTDSGFWKTTYLAFWKRWPATQGNIDWRSSCINDASWSFAKYNFTTLLVARTSNFLICSKGHTASVSCLTFNQDYIASGSIDATVRLWNANISQFLRSFKHSYSVRA